ncbi:hypothetical protein LOC51_00590 [Rubrivivax sp. JA1024]|nr:hypothetical protein [Rubrivivax sp. JA1024]
MPDDPHLKNVLLLLMTPKGPEAPLQFSYAIAADLDLSHLHDLTEDQFLEHMRSAWREFKKGPEACSNHKNSPPAGDDVDA